MTKVKLTALMVDQPYDKHQQVKLTDLKDYKPINGVILAGAISPSNDYSSALNELTTTCKDYDVHYYSDKTSAINVLLTYKTKDQSLLLLPKDELTYNASAQHINTIAILNAIDETIYQKPVVMMYNTKHIHGLQLFDDVGVDLRMFEDDIVITDVQLSLSRVHGQHVIIIRNGEMCLISSYDQLISEGVLTDMMIDDLKKAHKRRNASSDFDYWSLDQLITLLRALGDVLNINT